jgi:nucleotide-binding universal stress UspA family protein
VVDLEEIPDSENPVVVSFAIDRLIKRAGEKMKSLREIISLNGIQVKEEIVMGNVRTQLLDQIDMTKPNVIVIGRNVDKSVGTRSLLRYITQNSNVPVLVVPQSHNPKIPNRAVLASDMDPARELNFTPFFDIIKKISHELSILNIKSGYFANSGDALSWIKNLNKTYGVDAKLLHQDNATGVKGIVEFIRTHKIDLLCTVKSDKSIYHRLFDRNIANQLTSEVEVPVLVIKS